MLERANAVYSLGLKFEWRDVGVASYKKIGTTLPDSIVDEALAVGDEKFQAQCLTELRRLKDEGRTAMLVSHDVSLLRQVCRRLVLLDAGAVREDGPIEQGIERLGAMLERVGA